MTLNKTRPLSQRLDAAVIHVQNGDGHRRVEAWFCLVVQVKGRVAQGLDGQRVAHPDQQPKEQSKQRTEAKPTDPLCGPSLHGRVTRGVGVHIWSRFEAN